MPCRSIRPPFGGPMRTPGPTRRCDSGRRLAGIGRILSGPIDWIAPCRDPRRSPGRLQRADARLVRARRSPSRRAPRRWAGRRSPAAAHADPRAHRQRQDPRRLPLVPRSAVGGAATGAERRSRVLYVCPLKALAYDVERNLRAPLAGIRRTAERDRVGGPGGAASRQPDRRHAGRRAPRSSSKTRRTSSSPRPSRSTCCSPARRARSCAASSTSSSTRCTPSPPRSVARTWR